jgi:hypothetical protein
VIFLLSNFPSSVSLWTKVILKHKTEYQHRHLQSLVEVTEGREMLENLKKVGQKYVYCTGQAW